MSSKYETNKMVDKITNFITSSKKKQIYRDCNQAHAYYC